MFNYNIVLNKIEDVLFSRGTVFALTPVAHCCNAGSKLATKIPVPFLHTGYIAKSGNEIRLNLVIRRVKINYIDNFDFTIFPLIFFLLVGGNYKQVVAVEFFGGLDEGVEFAIAA